MIRSLFIALLIFCTISLKAQQPKSEKGDLYYQEAKDWQDKRNNEKAIKAYSNARREYLKEQNYYRYYITTDALSIMYQVLQEGVLAERVILETISLMPKTNNDQLVLHAKLQDNLGYTYLSVLDQPEKALEAYTHSITLYESIGKSSAKENAFELVNRALTHQQLSHYQSSIDDLLKAIAIYENDKETPPQDLANNYYTLGLNYSELEEFEKAIFNLRKGLALIEALGKGEAHAKFYNALGNVYNSKEQYSLALENYTLAKNINESLFGKDEANYAQNVINIGNTYKNTGDWETALANYKEVLAIYQKTPPPDLDNVIDLFLTIGRITDDLGLYEKSEALNQQALTVALAIGKNSLAEASVYNHMAAVAYNHGEYDKSLTFHFKEVSILQANNYPENGYYAQIYDGIGSAYTALNDFDLAIQYKEKAVDLYTRQYGTSHSSTALAIGNVGLSYESFEQYDKALEYLIQSLGLLSKNTNTQPKDVGITCLDIGRMYLKKNETQKAIEYLEKARIIFDSNDKNLNKAKAYDLLGFAYASINDQTKAAKCLQQSIIANVFNFHDTNFDSSPSQPEHINFYELVSAYISKADLYRKRGDKNNLIKGLAILDAADKILKETAIDFSSTKDRLELAQLNSFFTESGLLLADQLYALTKDPIYLEKAFYFSERSKANELLADIKMSRSKSLSRISKKTLERRKEITMRLNALQQQLASAYSVKDQSLIAKLKATEFDVTKEFEFLQEEIIKQSPKLNSIIHQRSLPTWKEVKNELDAKTVIVSYTITDSAKYIFIGNATAATLKKINLKINLEKLVRGYINQIKFQGPAVKEISDQLTGILWTPVEEAIAAMGLKDIENIIILAEGPLNYLPFESLGKDKFLLEKYTIHYQLSAAMLLNAAKSKPKSKPSFIAMAPVFEDKETNYVNKTCQRFVEFSRKADTTSRAFSLNGNYISPLPGTRTEVEKINQLQNDKGIFTKIFIEEAANEELIKKGELENFDYVHLATHGFVNSEYPELSGLLLTQNPQSTEDGILYTGEILGLTFNAELVTLSACETALGKKVEGEGVRGLTTAFLFAGAKNVIASLWKVADESTSDLMITFYTELLSGKNKASSLRAAKLSLIHSEKYHHPYYWAPFILVGNN